MLRLLAFTARTNVMLQMLYENTEKEQESFEKKLFLFLIKNLKCT